MGILQEAQGCLTSVSQKVSGESDVALPFDFRILMSLVMTPVSAVCTETPQKFGV
jgi:hypothetical protein